ncbi:hypothetical protein F5Y12DRAFT_178385 [Xylaria sp. FL1777]|nr:hypothetical protein F5Y12DRAFT_178385 [Xylaria sp. FL1777]
MLSSSTSRAVELRSSEEDSTVGSDSISSQSDETTDPTEFELFPGESAQTEGQKLIRDEEHNGDGDSVFNSNMDPLSAANSDPDELLLCVGAKLIAQEDTEPPFPSTVSHPADSPGSRDGHAITVRENYAPWDEPPREESSVSSKTESTLDNTKFLCLTQGYVGRDSCDLHLHRGYNRFIGRWKQGSVIKYSIDYESFSANGRSDCDACYALKSLQNAVELWNCVDIGVKFEFVEPNTGPIIFKLKYKHEPEGGSPDTRHLVLARSFFPVDAVPPRSRPCKLYVYASSFDTSFRPYMMRTFLHESAHILGGRHQNADKNESGLPCVLLGSPNDMSVLATYCHPRNISLHWQDIKLFHDFMGFPKEHNIDGFPIRDIDP